MHPISYFQGAMLGLLQGVSELFPVSSLGHSVILPGLVGWNIHQNQPYFLTFLVATHLATALVLLAFFWKDWVRIVKGLGRSLRDREIARPRREARLAAIVGTIPAGLLGVTLQDSLRKLFASPEYASIFLACNGLLLFGAEMLRRRAPETTDEDDTRIARKVGWWQSFTVGAAQAMRSFPGSRARARRWAGDCSSACRTRTPLGSRSFSRRRSSSPPRCSSCRISPGIRGTACAARRSSARSAPAFTAYLAVRFLMRYFETRTLTPFAIYCLCAGTAAAIYFAV